ncbi:hypothetical protein INT47_003106, partial [Mucor saturninus]
LLYSNSLLYGIVIGGLTAAITVHPIWPLHHLQLVIIMVMPFLGLYLFP